MRRVTTTTTACVGLVLAALVAAPCAHAQQARGPRRQRGLALPYDAGGGRRGERPAAVVVVAGDVVLAPLDVVAPPPRLDILADYDGTATAPVRRRVAALAIVRDYDSFLPAELPGPRAPAAPWHFLRDFDDGAVTGARAGGAGGGAEPAPIVITAAAAPSTELPAIAVPR